MGRRQPSGSPGWAVFRGAYRAAVRSSSASIAGRRRKCQREKKGGVLGCRFFTRPAGISQSIEILQSAEFASLDTTHVPIERGSLEVMGSNFIEQVDQGLS